MARPMANDPPFATLNHDTADLGIPKSQTPRVLVLILSAASPFDPVGRPLRAAALSAPGRRAFGRTCLACFESIVGEPIPHLALTEQRNAQIAANDERLPVGAHLHERVVGRAVTRIENGPVLVSQSVAAHALDECDAEDGSILLFAFAAGAAPGSDILAGLGKHFDDLSLVDPVALGDAKPSLRLCRLIAFFPEPSGGRHALLRDDRRGGRPERRTNGHDEEPSSNAMFSLHDDRSGSHLPARSHLLFVSYSIAGTGRAMRVCFSRQIACRHRRCQRSMVRAEPDIARQDDLSIRTVQRITM